MRPRQLHNTLALLLTALLLSACAAATAPRAGGATAAPDDLSAIRQQLDENAARIQRLQDSLVMLEVRLLDQQRTVDSLRQQLATGEIKPGAAPTAGRSDAGSKTPTEIYLAAFGDYADGNYRKSIDGFSTFLSRFPSNDYAGNARYWLADCYFSLGDYAQASIEFDRVYTDFPQGSKAPDALLKKAAAQHQLGRDDEAMQTIQLLKERYPKSAAARRAEQAQE